MPEVAGAERLLTFARKLMRTDSFADVLKATRDEIRSTTGYSNVWLMVGEKEEPDELHLIQFDGANSEKVHQVAQRLRIAGDAFLAAVIASDSPIVIPDARTDPRTDKNIVEALQNRTIVNIPLRLSDKPFGLLGTGTFGEEGCVPPTDRQLEYMVGIASQVSVAVSRIMNREIQEQAKQELRYRSLFEHMNTVFIRGQLLYKDQAANDARIVEANSALERYLQRPRAEIIGRSLSELIPGFNEILPYFLPTCDEVVRSGVAQRLEVDWTPLNQSYVVVIHSPGPEQIVAIITDITNLRQQANDLRRLQEQLRASLREKEVLLQEIHHRVKNNLQVIASLINMQVRRLTDPAAVSALGECQSRILVIALIHEQLYRSHDYAVIPLSEYISSLARTVLRAFGASETVTLHLRLDERVTVPVDRAIPCGLIANELITNALKHGFPNRQSGNMTLELLQRDTDLVFSVANDGVPLPEAFTVASERTLGLQLVSTLIRQLGAGLEVTASPATKFSITFSAEAS